MNTELLIILSIILYQSYIVFIVEDEPNFDKFLGEFEPIIESNNDRWLVSFIRYDSKFIHCKVMPIAPRVFIGDGECVYRYSNRMPWKIIVIDFVHKFTRFPGMASVEKENIFYHTTLRSEYDPNLPKIAILITNQPVVADLCKFLLTPGAQSAYKNVPSYNEKKQLKRIVGSWAYFENVNFLKCFMSTPEGKSVVLRCSDLGPTYLMCHFYKTDYSVSKYRNLVNFLICPLKTNKEKVVLVGVLSKEHKYSLDSYGPVVHLKFELVVDNSLILQKKITQWFIKNPERITYDLVYN